MNGLQMTIVLSCLHCVFFIFRQKEEATRERSGTRMLRLPSWTSTTSMSWKTGKKWWIHCMHIITVKNTSTSCYCKSAWTTSIGFTNSILELLYIEVSVCSWWLFCLFTVWESFGRLCFQRLTTVNGCPTSRPHTGWIISRCAAVLYRVLCSEVFTFFM